MPSAPADRVDFAPGDLVRTSRSDPAHHHRLPRYARGACGRVVECQGSYPLADERARGLAAEPQPVYVVCFAAAELFGEGDHDVTLCVWQAHLTRERP